MKSATQHTPSSLPPPSRPKRIDSFTRLYRTWPQGSVPPPSSPDVAFDEEVAVAERVDTPWRVILYNDAVHTHDEVIVQLVKATGCSSKNAEQITWTVHTSGKALAFEGAFEECFRVQGILREIQLVTEIEG